MRYIVVKNIGELVTLKGSKGLRTGKDMNEAQILKNAYFVVENGKFTEVGTGLGYQKYQASALIIDAQGKLITPGLIDSHTHLVHAGSREHELAMKLAGYTYLDILKQGGGIFDTVAQTTQASFNDLLNQSQKTLNRMLLHGTTVVEAKSGYGLELSTELKQLEVAKTLDQRHPIKIINTFMGAHAIPPQYKDNRPKFIALLKEMIKEIKKQNLAKFCDVFCEDGVFSLEETREFLTFAKSLGYGIKMHADEIVSMGGASLAQELGCISADHLMATKESDMDQLAKGRVVANLLPLTSFYLNSNYANARLMIKKGCGVAIATDYNPGSSPCENLQLAMQVACLKMKMTPKEVITATTINAAVSLGLDETKGTIEGGKDADFVIFDCPNLDYLFYRFGINHVEDVYIGGKQVVSQGRIIGV